MLRDLQKESPNMNYQVSKVKIAIAKTWDAKYADWENKPVEKYKDDWITSNITRFICLIRVCAKGLAEKADKRKDWVSEIFGEGVVGESQEEGVEPLGNPCGISAAVLRRLWVYSHNFERSGPLWLLQCLLLQRT